MGVNETILFGHRIEGNPEKSGGAKLSSLPARQHHVAGSQVGSGAVGFCWIRSVYSVIESWYSSRGRSLDREFTGLKSTTTSHRTRGYG